MARLNNIDKEVNAKIVYYGPGLSGKTTNIEYIYRKLRPDQKAKLVSLATQTDRTLFFDFLPVELGNVKGFKTRFHLYTVPGQVLYNETRKMVLKGADAIVFVADSQRQMLDANIESLKNLEENLRAYGKNLSEIPHIIQFNKRDLQNAMTLEDLYRKLNKYKAPFFESVATSGTGVLETLSAVSRIVLRCLREQSPDASNSTVSQDEFFSEETESDINTDIGHLDDSFQGTNELSEVEDLNKFNSADNFTESVQQFEVKSEEAYLKPGIPEMITDTAFKIPVIYKPRGEKKEIALSISIRIDNQSEKDGDVTSSHDELEIDVPPGSNGDMEGDLIVEEWLKNAIVKDEASGLADRSQNSRLDEK